MLALSPACAPDAALGVAAARSSTSSSSVFHSPQTRQRPVHCGAAAPHSRQRWTVFTLAMPAPYELGVTQFGDAPAPQPRAVARVRNCLGIRDDQCLRAGANRSRRAGSPGGRGSCRRPPVADRSSSAGRSEVSFGAGRRPAAIGSRAERSPFRSASRAGRRDGGPQIRPGRALETLLADRPPRFLTEG